MALSTKNKKLRAVLVETLVFLSECNSSVYAQSSLEEIRHEINKMIHSIEDEKAMDLSALDLLFAPTGDLQEISLDNNKGKEFLPLSEKFERIFSK